MRKIRSFALGAWLIVLVAVPPLGAGGPLVVTFFYCHQGDAALLETPNGAKVLMDAGPLEDWNDFDAGRDVLDPYFKAHGIRRIDHAVFSHAHLDHIGGFKYIVQNYPVGAVYDSGIPYASPVYEELLETLLAKKIEYKVVRRGDSLDWDPALQVTVLSPPEDRAWEGLNDNSLVIRVQHGDVVFLFTGDIQKEAEKYLAGQDGLLLRSHILKSPHHGSKTSSTEDFLALVKPQAVVVSSGRRNRFGHPHPEVLDRYKAHRFKVYRTGLQGNVQVVSDGKRFKVKTSKSRQKRSKKRK